MAKDAAFTVELEPALREALIAEAEAVEQPPSKIVRDLIDGFVRQRREGRAHDAWFRADVEQALREADDPTVKRIPNEAVDASWERKRAGLVGQGLEGRMVAGSRARPGQADEYVVNHNLQIER